MKIYQSAKHLSPSRMFMFYIEVSKGYITTLDSNSNVFYGGVVVPYEICGYYDKLVYTI